MSGYEKLWAVFWICLFASTAIGSISNMDCVAFCTVIAEPKP